MKVLVVKNFFDLKANTQRTKGEVLELAKPRCLEFIALGFAQEVQEEKKKTKK